jgi:hypothetical protein
MSQIARDRANEVGVELERDETGKRGRAATGSLKPKTSDLSSGVGEGGESVGHV